MGKNRNPVYDTAYAMYLDGYSLEQVAKEIGVTRQCVHKAFKQRKLHLRGVNFKPYQYYDGKKFTLRDTGYFALTTEDRVLMHRYVWEKEKGSILCNWDLHHINLDKSDNRIENLECLPKSEHTKKYSPSNNQYGVGRRSVVMMAINGNETRTFETTTIAAKELGINRTGINMAINGRLKTYKKNKWKYADN